MKTGLRINELAAKQQEGQRWIKRVIVETGGKDALVVDDSADLDAAAEDLVKSAYGYAGQKCSAASRAILHQDIYDEVLQKVVEKTRALNVGVPNNPEVFMGPVQNEPQFEKVANYIEVGDEEAERVLGENPGDGGQGYFVKPTIYSEVDSEARIAREEIFGPVLSVLKARDFDEALKIANDTPYGLTGGIYSRNRDHLEQARTEFKAGNVYFNRGITGALVGVQPFGGYGLSGTDSKAGGPDYLPLHMLPRTVVERF
jgi:1-pyrroline-5-carboxylate dehydrogenase